VRRLRDITRCVGAVSSRGHDDAAAVAVECLKCVASGALPDELRLLAGGCDVDRQLDPQCVGETQERWEGGVVLAALEARDGGLGHLQALCERGRQEQHERQLAYLEWREHAARRLARQAGPLGRLTHRREDFYPQINRQALGVYRRCREIVYPADRASSHGDRRPACHYCHETYQVEAYREDAPASTEREVRL
jgi:hypothetical protein